MVYLTCAYTSIPDQELPNGNTFLCELRDSEHVPRWVELGCRGEKAVILVYEDVVVPRLWATVSKTLTAVLYPGPAWGVKARLHWAVA